MYVFTFQVLPSNDGETIIPADQRHRSPRKLDLVYLEDSPDFCRSDYKSQVANRQTHIRISTSIFFFVLCISLPINSFHLSFFD